MPLISAFLLFGFALSVLVVGEKNSVKSQLNKVEFES
jgi:hypothetical protein